MATISVQGEQGGALLVVHADGSTDVYSVPTNASIYVTGQKGFGDLAQVDTNDSASAAVTTAGTIIAEYGAR